MCGNDWGSQKQGGYKTRPYANMFFVGATLVVALARTANGTHGVTT
jgi:hypothetical protein